jgi:predicted N-acetyltransferase YhbS
LMGDSGTLELELVPARQVDVERIAAVVNAAFAIYPFMEGERTDAEGVREEMGESGEFVIATDAGRIVACAMIKPSLDVHWDGESSNPGVSEPDAVYLGLVAVEPGIRKQGLGRRMIAEAERIARERGFGRVVLGTISEMGNVVYYEALGYEVVSRTTYEPGHWGLTIEHDFCVMVKQL